MSNSANQNWVTSDFTVPDQSLIIYFIIMILLGAFAITLHFKAKGKVDSTTSWYKIIFNLWSLFIAPLIFSLTQSSSLFEAIAATLDITIILAISSCLSMSCWVITYGIIWHLICKKKDEASWFSLSFVWIIGVLTGVPVFYFIIFLS